MQIKFCMHHKFRTRSETVKGLSFHAEKPWILASLANGVIQLWDYDAGALVEQFQEHKGPVRGIHFHDSCPLFVSGGDDKKIKVWNYELHGCLFTLLGHQSHVNTVQFHSRCPWIVSASKDCSIRIWNWQSRNCILVLTGHSDNVTSASFHPSKDLLVSSSLDRSIRIWEISDTTRRLAFPTNDMQQTGKMLRVLRSHLGGVLGAKFHPTLPLIFSVSDDRSIYLWEKKDDDMWVYEWMGWHDGRVSCVALHGRQSVVMSASEDKTICLWDGRKSRVRKCLMQFYNDNETNVWSLASHRTKSLSAVGHDSGMTVFKLRRVHLAFTGSCHFLFYVKDGFLRYYSYSFRIEASIHMTSLNHRGGGPIFLSYSHDANAVLISYSEVDGGGSYELLLGVIPKCLPLMRDTTTTIDAKRGGSGGKAVFVAHDRFAVLEKSENRVTIRNLEHEIVDQITLPVAADEIFCCAGTGNLLLCQIEEGRVVILFDLERKIVVGNIQTSSSIRYAIWAKDMESVALVSKYSIVLANKELVHQCTLQERNCIIKSGAWDDDNGVFLYKTQKHIKYCLPNGETGIIKSNDAPLCLTKVSGRTIYCLDHQDRKPRTLYIDPTEYVLKASLLKGRYDKVMDIIKKSSQKLCGDAIISYLLQKGVPEVALHLIKDERTRFNVAIESGNIQVALACAEKIDEEIHWCRLGREALRQGYVRTTEYAYQRSNNCEGLAFLYVITGNLGKLSSTTNMQEGNNSNRGGGCIISRFNLALYLGDVQERVKLLKNAGHSVLANITAAVHGLTNNISDVVPSLLPIIRKPLMPPPPRLIKCCGGDWPLIITD